MEPASKNSAGKIVAGLALGGMGLLGLGLSLCGSGFTVFTLIAKLRGHETGEARAWSGLFLVTGSASLLLGLALIVLTVVAWQRWFKPR